MNFAVNFRDESLVELACQSETIIKRLKEMIDLICQFFKTVEMDNGKRTSKFKIR